MNISINYFYNSPEALDQLQIEDIGNCAIIANDDIDNNFVLIVKTGIGVTQVIEYGPFCIDGSSDGITSVISYYSRFDYNEHRLERMIDNFLNNPKRNITQAECIEEEEAKKYVKNILESINDKYC